MLKLLLCFAATALVCHAERCSFQKAVKANKILVAGYFPADSEIKRVFSSSDQTFDAFFCFTNFFGQEKIFIFPDPHNQRRHVLIQPQDSQSLINTLSHYLPRVASSAYSAFPLVRAVPAYSVPVYNQFPESPMYVPVYIPETRPEGQAYVSKAAGAVDVYVPETAKVLKTSSIRRRD